MNPTSLSTSLTIDVLLRDTFITVLELRNGGSSDNGVNLYQKAKDQIEAVQTTLRSNQFSEAAISDITYAQCAILDEAVMNRHLLNTDDIAYQTWVGIPLQIHFFNTLEAGEALYERIQLAIAQISPDPLVIACFHRVLLLGFSGKYGTNRQHPEREAIFRRLEVLVKQMGQLPLESHHQVFLGARKRLFWQLPLRNRWWVGLAVLALCVYGLWLLFDYQLNSQLARAIPTNSLIAQQLPVMPILNKLEAQKVRVPEVNNLNEVNERNEATKHNEKDVKPAQDAVSQTENVDPASKKSSFELPYSMKSTLIPVVQKQSPANLVYPIETGVARD